MQETLSIKPYARLITMLGDQLITDEAVALVEIIKNSYDADAEHVSVDFIDFDDDYNLTPYSKIVICDDGTGMTESTLKQSWMNPASMDKLERKRQGKAITKLGRYIQGEKGIGRFAIFKIGSNATIQTSPDDLNELGKTYRLKYAFEDYGLDFLSGDEPLMLEDIKIPFEDIPLDALYCGTKKHGTRIEISSLRGEWGKKKIESVVRAVVRVRPLFDDSNDQFSVSFLRNGSKVGDLVTDVEKKREQLKELIKAKAVYRITEGHYSCENHLFSFVINDKSQSFTLLDATVGKKEPQLRELAEKDKDVGDFGFSFYIFDLAASQLDDPQHYLTKEERSNVKENRIYLYRDSVRVLPYGDPDDDWLQIDIARGLEKVGGYFSNDQIVGQILISGTGNKNLKDKTSREGLVDDGRAKQAFIDLINLFLKQIKVDYFDKYRLEKKKAEEEKDRARRQSPVLAGELAEELERAGMPSLAKKAKSVADACARDKKWYQEKLEIAERLAGVGLAVETATHDIRLFLNLAIERLNNIQLTAQLMGNERDDLSKVLGDLTTVKSLLDKLDVLYPAAKNKERIVDLDDVVSVVLDRYASVLKRNEIQTTINRISPLKVKCVDAVLIQTLLNLFDNAFYWCKEAIGGGRITITIDGDSGRLLIKDNGKGVRKDDAAYIFEAFFTRKGEEGRGLGLYIAKQLMQRYGFDVFLTKNEKDDYYYMPEFEMTFKAEEK